MIRQPTTHEAAYRWHKAALAGERPPVYADEPHCGWFRRRLVARGPWVSARIWLYQVLDMDTGDLAEPEAMLCEVSGEEHSAIHMWTWLAKNPISEAEFDLMVAKIKHAGNYAPLAPILQPETPVDLSARPTLPGGD